jgi:hypothetical protein
MIVPDGIEPLRGYRGWLIVEGPNGPRLRSLWRDVLWDPADGLTAGCLSYPSRFLDTPVGGGGHAVPSALCTCGIYALRSPASISTQIRTPVRPPVGSFAWRHPTGNAAWPDPGCLVLGEVSGWGTVVDHRLGWRAERARVTALLMPAEPEQRDWTWRVADVYGVPVVRAFEGPGGRPVPRAA